VHATGSVDVDNVGGCVVVDGVDIVGVVVVVMRLVSLLLLLVLVLVFCCCVLWCICCR